jgi:hypothetical protein
MVNRGPAQNRTVVLQSPTGGFVLQSTPFLALVPLAIASKYYP